MVTNRGIFTTRPVAPSLTPTEDERKYFDFIAATEAVCRFIHTNLYTSAQVDDGVPVILGGGIVRDALLGGVINDIDIWLPSNIRIEGIEEARMGLQNELRTPVDVIFQVNAAEGANSENYQDVSNHWVLEFTFRGFKFNIMRTMVPWHTPQGFFNGVMQNFDIDLCMMFVGWQRGTMNNEWKHTVIIPQHMKDNLLAHRPYIDLGWNAWRLDHTSEARINSRNAKMRDRYDVDTIALTDIARGSIVAAPVTIGFLLEHMEYLPLPILPVDETIELEEEEDVTAAPLPGPSLFSAQPPAAPPPISSMTREQIEEILARTLARGQNWTNTFNPRS